MLVYDGTLGAAGLPIGPHILLVSLWISAIYGLSIATSLIRARWLRAAVLYFMGLATVVVTTLFYAVTLFCLYGFRDILTIEIITVYFKQLPSMIASLPFDWAIVVLAITALVVILLALSAVLAVCLAEVAKDYQSTRSSRYTIPVLASASTIALTFILAAPSTWFTQRLEPWSSGLHDLTISESGYILQADPASAARDKEIREQYPTTPQGLRLNVVLIYVDALRADVLQPYGADFVNMPFMSSLVTSHQITQFPRLYAGCSMTLCAVGSLLQSRPAHRIDPDNFSLPDLLQMQGYQTRYLLSGDRQHFLTLKQYHGEPDFYLDGFDIDPKRSNDDFLVLEELKKFPSASEIEQPQFMVFSPMSVHVWGPRYPQFRQWQPDSVSAGRSDGMSAEPAQVYRNNYLNGVYQVDHVLEKIWQWLDQSGYLKNSIVVITSDHGESLGEHGIFGHARSLNTPELLVPLWIYDPTGRVVSRPIAFQDDISPTILDVLGLPQPESWTGRSLILPTKERWHPLYYINSRNLFGLIWSREGSVLKYIFDRKNNQEMIYDLQTDLLDQHDILPSISATLQDEFRNKLQETFKGFLPPEWEQKSSEP